jgi:hypothetical protein
MVVVSGERFRGDCLSKSRPRRRMRDFPTVVPRLQYLILPYANFNVGQLGKGTEFSIGPFTIWKDTEVNWRKFLNISRPAKHLSMYVNRAGGPVESIWIATTNTIDRVTPERWQQLTAALFYLAWARIPYLSMQRPAAEDFYADPFILPQGAEDDSAGHVRWSKYGNTFWSDIKIYPAPDVSTIGTQIDLPIAQGRDSYPFHDPTTADLFEALATELAKLESRILTALWFLMEACYRSSSRSSFAEDIQSVCTAFEALLTIKRKGYSSEQVFEKLKSVFESQAASAEDELSSRSPAPERPEVLERLGQWTAALYDVRNAYTHGKAVENYLFYERSLWQDAFEVFRLAANRLILGRPEYRGDGASLLEKRLMSVSYFDDVVDVFAGKEWVQSPPTVRETIFTELKQLGMRLVYFLLRRTKPERPDILREAIRKGRALDPELVESVTGIKKLRQALYNICSACYVTLKQTNLSARPDVQQLRAFVAKCDRAYRNAGTSGTFDTDHYIRKIAPAMNSLAVTVPLQTRDIELYELIAPYKALLRVYQNFTKPILKAENGDMDELLTS